MDLNLSDEQRLLRESVDRFIAETYNADHRRKAAGDPLGFSPAIWKQFAELGWLALPIAEEYGGLGAGSVETGIVMEAFGRGLVSEPYLVDRGDRRRPDRRMRQRGAEAGDSAQGRRRFAVPGFRAFGARGALRSRACRDDGERRRRTAGSSTASKIAVLDGHAAGQIIVSARIANAQWRIRQTVPVPGAGGHARPDPARLRAARRRPRLQPRSRRRSASRPTPCSATAAMCCRKIEAVVDRALAALGSEAVGIMQIMFDMTLEYTKVRQQFGRPLSANQVIRHRLADMAMHCDEARSIALRAALMVDAEPVARGRAASGAKAKIGKCARFVAEQSVQLHGAMGVTEELDIGSYFKRLLAFDTLFGGSAHHYRRHAALGRTNPNRNPEPERQHGSHLQPRRTRLRTGSPRLHRDQLSRRK